MPPDDAILQTETQLAADVPRNPVSHLCDLADSIIAGEKRRFDAGDYP